MLFVYLLFWKSISECDSIVHPQKVLSLHLLRLIAYWCVKVDVNAVFEAKVRTGEAVKHMEVKDDDDQEVRVCVVRVYFNMLHAGCC